MARIDRTEARSWSKDRIKEELHDLQRRVAEYYEDIHSTESEQRELENEVEERQEEGDYYYTREKTLDAMSNHAENLYSIVTEMESDIEFLKSLL